MSSSPTDCIKIGADPELVPRQELTPTPGFFRKHPLVKDVYYNYIAQVFQQVFPDSVQDDGEGFLQIDSYPADVYAVAAIQELDRLVVEKNARISALEERVALLEGTLATRLARIEKALGR